MDTKTTLGIGSNPSCPEEREMLIKYINLKLAAQGLPVYEKADTTELEIAHELLESIKERNRTLGNCLPPVDQRIQNFLNRYLADTEDEVPTLPADTFVLDRHGIARELSLPADGNEFSREDLTSYRLKQGVLHNPKSDRRTTKGVFHVADGGLPVPPDKKEVPKIAFQRILDFALNNAPEDLKQLPFTSNQEDQAATFVSLLLRPLVVPAVPGYTPEKSMEVRFFVPGNVVCNLDFVESIFGNAGDPFLAAHDAALDPDGWTGTTGCVILAPHLGVLTKKELGLPNVKDATERQKRDGMCWEKEDELYNDGGAFKICCRDESGVVVTIISDNYFGYCKKEVKTQIGYSANIYGLAEEEHAGGALASPCYNLGTHFIPDSNLKAKAGHTFANVAKCLGDSITVFEEGYATDNKYPNVYYIQEDAEISLETLLCTWTKDGKEQSLKVLPERTFVHPSGYRVHLEKHPETVNWRLIGTVAEGTLIHKPCTVSGGGKSEISKSVYDATLYGPVFTGDFDKDMDQVAEIINKDYSDRFADLSERGESHVSRKVLSSERSLGSVIKLLNPSKENTEEYNAWLESIPSSIKALVFMVKRFYQEEWALDWRSHFSVDIVNGEPGHEVKFEGRKLNGSYLRVGLRNDGSWCTYKLRQDFLPSQKIQWEDDISSSIMVPASAIEDLNPEYKNPSVKVVENCEYRFFQRPDEAKVRGYDKQAEEDIATEGVFISNFEPKTKADAIALVEDSVNFNLYTQPMQNLIRSVAEADEEGFFVSSAHARIVNGAPTKNPRYLQTRPSLLDFEPNHLTFVSHRLYREIAADKPLYTPVNATMPGRRNNPAEPGIRPLAVFNPVHFQELPELFMDFTASLTGKSPSTTGAGSEGALTKAPFNCLTATADLNAALLSFILGGYNGFTTAAGFVGTEHPVEHDISLLIPEIWSRMSEDERDPKNMIENGYLEKIEDFEYEGRTVPGSRLGYRITDEFVNAYMGRVFETPNAVFAESMLKPETQSLANFVDGIENMADTFEKVGKAYLSDGSEQSAIPPLKAVLEVMANGVTAEGKKITDPEVRELFTYDYVINSDWYKNRLTVKQEREVALLESQIAYLNDYIADPNKQIEADKLELSSKLAVMTERLAFVKSDAYIASINGTLGADPLFRG